MFLLHKNIADEYTPENPSDPMLSYGNISYK